LHTTLLACRSGVIHSGCLFVQMPARVDVSAGSADEGVNEVHDDDDNEDHVMTKVR
jgi:hypothetical protein